VEEAARGRRGRGARGDRERDHGDGDGETRLAGTEPDTSFDACATARLGRAARSKLDAVRPPRRFSQAISEGERISLIADVAGAEDARRAEESPIAAVAVRGDAAPVRGATQLPLLWRGPGSLEDARGAEADAYVLVADDVSDDGELERLYAQAAEWGLDCVVAVDDEEELERALERVDPEILLLAVGANEDGGRERVLELLPDVPAGKLVVADVGRALADDVLELERAGFDAVVVGVADLADVAGGRVAEA
jgi:indole-3-glycerol phosphate synthase